MDKREFPEEWFAQTAPVWDVSDLRANRPVLLVYVDHHPEALNYPLYRTLEYLERVGISARVFGPIQGGLEGYRLTRSEFEEHERGETPLFFLSHGPRFEYRGRTFSIQDESWSLLRHDVDFITWSHQDRAGKEYLPNEMIKRLQEALMRVASNVLDKPVRPLLDPFWFERRIRIPLFPKHQPAVHIFVGTPAEGDTLPFWVRFLMRVRQRGWAPVLVGPRGDDLRMLLQNVLEEADPMQDLPFIQGEAPVYYAIVPVVGDQYALETTAREGFHASGAWTLQWIRAYGGFFTGTQWARTLTSDNGLFHNNPGGMHIYDQEGQPDKNRDALPLVHESKEKSAVSTTPLLPVGVTFPESAEAYSPQNVENLTRLFRGLGIELVPVGGRGGYDWGTQASILARHYFAKVPVLVVASGEERALPEESPLLWCATYYQSKDLYSVRLNTLTVFLASVRDHLRQTSVHYETRSRFCMEPIEALSGLHRDA